MSLQELATAPEAAEPEKERRIAKRIRQVVDLIVSGECKTQKAAAARIGMHPDYVSRALKQPHVRVFIERRSRETIAAGLMRASARLNELMDSESEHVSLDAAKHVAAIGGIKPSASSQVSVSLDIRAGYIIDIAPEPRIIDAAASMPHTPTIDLKPLKSQDDV